MIIRGVGLRIFFFQFLIVKTDQNELRLFGKIS
jgi:hypothetical protein